jgi:hypothetical protein
MSEEDAYLVSSRGILKSCTSHSPFPVSSIQNVNYQPKGNQIYICSSAIQHFYFFILPNLSEPFVLVTGDSDATIPCDYPIICQSILVHPLLLCWYSQNCVAPFKKLRAIPIGLDYHTLSTGPHEWGYMADPITQENTLYTYTRNENRKFRCYGMFQFQMTTRYASDRHDAIKKIPSDLIDYQKHPMTRNETWEAMSQYVFIPSPHGNGLDCHRTWEALALGCIPIVKRSGISHLFEDHALRVWIVNDWSEITPESMKEAYMKLPPHNPEILSLKYWMSYIKS